MPLAATGETTVLTALLASRFLSLHTALPPSGEVTGGAYARQPVTFAQTSGPDPTIYKNTALVQFPTATASWGTITHFGIWSAASGGNLLGYNTVTTAKAVAIDDAVKWDPNALAVDTT
jgi:hypothetical protein